MRLVGKTVGVVVLYAVCTFSLGAGDATAAAPKKAEKKNLRSMRYKPGSKDQATAWRKELRSKIVALLKMDDLISPKTDIPLNPKTISTEKRDKYVLHIMEINSTKTRRMRIAVTLPTNLKGPFPAVVAIGGHSSTHLSCLESQRGYSRFAHVLSEKGYVTISRRVSQHKAYEKGRTLMGERLWDLMRCVDFLASRQEVDARRIGCGGLSLGGEMAMWLGAMDQRVAATVSSGFLTTMDQLERGHCMCWKFPGLRDLVDFADIYAMTAPRALLCQNGLKERPTWFSVSIARKALKEIAPIYADFKKPGNLELAAHKGGHEIDLPSLLRFFDKHLGAPAGVERGQ
ncbi:MAG: prolyl oligopeptidase family serine peptidase [Phycisphaerae bacterium]|jgi:hypothetical protein|nr:prolyl oligopeptidase family serine peptidase [Phycisphaerae bacterium]